MEGKAHIHIHRLLRRDASKKTPFGKHCISSRCTIFGESSHILLKHIIDWKGLTLHVPSKKLKNAACIYSKIHVELSHNEFWLTATLVILQVSCKVGKRSIQTHDIRFIETTYKYLNIRSYLQNSPIKKSLARTSNGRKHSIPKRRY